MAEFRINELTIAGQPTQYNEEYYLTTSKLRVSIVPHMGNGALVEWFEKEFKDKSFFSRFRNKINRKYPCHLNKGKDGKYYHRSDSDWYGYWSRQTVALYKLHNHDRITDNSVELNLYAELILNYYNILLEYTKCKSVLLVSYPDGCISSPAICFNSLKELINIPDPNREWMGLEAFVEISNVQNQTRYPNSTYNSEPFLIIGDFTQEDINWFKLTSKDNNISYYLYDRSEDSIRNFIDFIK